VLAGGGAIDGIVVWLGDVAPRFGSDARPGGGGGFDGVAGAAARIDAEAGGGGAEGCEADGGSGGGCDGGMAATLPWLGGCAGPGMPISVFFISCDGRETGTFAPEPGGGGGTADVRGWLFFPRPSKISRSEPPLLSSDIRVS